MKRILLGIVAILFNTMLFAQTVNISLDEYEKDVKAYGNAMRKLKSKEYNQGIDIITPLITKARSEEGYDKEHLASYYRLDGQLHLRIKKYVEAEKLYKQALQLLEGVGGKGKEDMSSTWYQLSLVYYYWGNHQKETMQAADKCVETALRYYGKNHSVTIDAYSLRANYNGFYNNAKGACEDKQQLFDIISQNMERNFAFLTASERTAYWNKYRLELQDMLGFARNLKITDGEFIDYIYDQQLLSKGILLSTESALQRSIDSDSNLAVLYNKIRELRNQALVTSNTSQTIEQATLEADKLERELTEKAKGVNDFLCFMRIRSSDVKSKLNAGDVAVEFAECPKGKDSIMYSAVILKPEWEHAHHLMLCEKKDIKRDSSNLVNLIWQPILNAVGSGIKNIYFAPTGLLYQIPFESHLLADGTSIGKKYYLYRMSSTRLLATGNNMTEGKDAILYGGLQYDTSISDLAADMKKYESHTSTTRSVNRGACADEALTPLPATEKEVAEIVKVFKDTIHPVVAVNTMTGKQGTETSFKSLSGQHKRIAHIATHGFYNSSTTADNALTNSGLYFAGADNFLLGETIPTSVDNGVLTAEEVADMDLTGMDIVTLSACQTGLGNVSADGVLGLQRGFKKAGVKSILMSLWSVDDEATCRLMTEFYKNWIVKKMSKHDALEKAKETVRNTPKWKDQKFWAPFILLDATD